MNVIALASHDVAVLDQRHLGLLTAIVAVWFVSAWLGATVRRRNAPEILFVPVVIFVAIMFVVDPWLGLAALQVPIFVLKGYRTGSFL